jgi:uroporphyrinogen-III synthase
MIATAYEINKTGLKEITKVFQATALNHDLDDILHLAVKSSGRLLKADQCFLYLLNDEDDELILRAAETGRSEALGNVRLGIGEGITGWVAREKKPVAISERAYEDKRFKQFQLLPEDKYEGFLSVPMLYKEKLVGVLNIQHKRTYQYSEEQVSLLKMLAQMIAVAIENARLMKENKQMEDALETRKLVERAKGILMKRMGIAENDAYAILRKKSMDMRKPMKDIAEVVIQTENTYL